MPVWPLDFPRNRRLKFLEMHLKNFKPLKEPEICFKIYTLKNTHRASSKLHPKLHPEHPKQHPFPFRLSHSRSSGGAFLERGKLRHCPLACDAGCGGPPPPWLHQRAHAAGVSEVVAAGGEEPPAQSPKNPKNPNNPNNPARRRWLGNPNIASKVLPADLGRERDCRCSRVGWCT